MRLTSAQVELLKNKIRAYIPEAQIYLFGSRIDDTQKGGDIDLLVLADRRLSFDEKFAVKLAFYQQFGEQKIDIISFSRNDETTFKQITLLNAVLL